jgi:two-component system, OmpR family, response regulator ResD
MKYKILVAEDDKHIRKLISDYLRSENYEVIEAIDGKDALDKFYDHHNTIDLLILDIMMPYKKGYEVCQIIRKDYNTPVIFLTALSDTEHEIKGFDVGADDYITKPFEYQVFVSRVKSILKRVNKQKKYSINNIEINIDAHQVKIGQEDITLTPKEFELLIYLVNNKNIALSREQILDSVWGYDFYGDIRTVDTHIKQLRAKLKYEGESIKTVRGYGYKLEVI